jgi:hypothetical protein
VDLAIVQIKDTWKSETKELFDSKAFWPVSVRTLKTLFQASPTNVVKSEFARICKTSVPLSPPGDYRDYDKSYDNALLECVHTMEHGRKG